MNFTSAIRAEKLLKNETLNPMFLLLQKPAISITGSIDCLSAFKKLMEYATEVKKEKPTYSNFPVSKSLVLSLRTLRNFCSSPITLLGNYF